MGTTKWPNTSQHLHSSEQFLLMAEATPATAQSLTPEHTPPPHPATAPLNKTTLLPPMTMLLQPTPPQPTSSPKRPPEPPLSPTSPTTLQPTLLRVLLTPLTDSTSPS